MPITLELTDDQALKIVAQIGGILSGRKFSEPAPVQRNTNVPQKTIIDYIQEQPKGKLVFIKDLSYKFKTETKFISNCFAKAKALGLIKMAKRGTWEVI